MFILALAKGIDNDDVGGSKPTNDELLHLRTEGLPSGIRTCLQDLK